MHVIMIIVEVMVYISLWSHIMRGHGTMIIKYLFCPLTMIQSVLK